MFQNDLECLKCFRKVKNGLEWFRNGLEWFRMVYNCLELLRDVQSGKEKFTVV